MSVHFWLDKMGNQTVKNQYCTNEHYNTKCSSWNKSTHKIKLKFLPEKQQQQSRKHFCVWEEQNTDDASGVNQVCAQN